MNVELLTLNSHKLFFLIKLPPLAQIVGVANEMYVVFFKN